MLMEYSKRLSVDDVDSNVLFEDIDFEELIMTVEYYKKKREEKKKTAEAQIDAINTEMEKEKREEKKREEKMIAELYKEKMRTSQQSPLPPTDRSFSTPLPRKGGYDDPRKTRSIANKRNVSDGSDSQQPSGLFGKIISNVFNEDDDYDLICGSCKQLHGVVGQNESHDFLCRFCGAINASEAKETDTEE
eukprot:TRINITY_DN4206_c0_g1_i1.p1 TRINITY_DN4206_c0_g1~~TRINITY_DN4206_c0_g1_i1.p1  ORF type:complete len:190 (-),score=58.46 TRINITY_DN4206_c0_g1_i1:50-619(-)